MTSPGMSVVVFMPHHFSWLDPLLRSLRAQTASQNIELIVVVRSRATFSADETVLHGFGRSVLVESEAADSHVSAKIVGLRAATTPIVAFAEDHCFPEPDWAERLMAAHAGDCGAVGPSMKNGNPDTALSRSAFALHWGSWAHPAIAGTAEVLPPHNTSYKRSILLAVQDKLHDLLVVEHFLHAGLREAGHVLLVEPSAVVRHCNISKVRPWWRISYNGGRVYGSYRVKHEKLSAGQRIVRTLMSPLVPVVRLKREMPAILRTGGSRADRVAAIAWSVVHLIVHSVGEAAGYAFGSGNSERECADLETSRFRDMRDSDLRPLRALRSPQIDDPLPLLS